MKLNELQFKENGHPSYIGNGTWYRGNARQMLTRWSIQRIQMVAYDVQEIAKETTR